jgi:predicted DNA-binding ribbon-helix-helix protein
MKSAVAKRSIVIDRHKTSVSLEDQFWAALKEIAAEKQLTLSELISDIDSRRGQGNLSSAVRLFIIAWYRPAEPAGLRSPAANGASLDHQTA